MAPTLAVDGHRARLRIAHGQLIDDWIPVASARAGGIRLQVTYATQPRTRTASLRMIVTNDDGVRKSPSMFVPGGNTSQGDLQTLQLVRHCAHQ